MSANKLLGLYEGYQFPDGTLTFCHLGPGDLMPGPSIAAGEYRPPVTPPSLDWYIAQFHSAGHTGVDINLNQPPYGDVELGSPVFATCAGMVLFAGLARGTSWGNLIITASLELTGLIFWRYAHLKDVLVEPGHTVYVGEHIGTIGKGYRDRYWAHLHLDAWRGQMIAPESYLTRWVDWVDPLDVWSEAGYAWGWGRRDA